MGIVFIKENIMAFKFDKNSEYANLRTKFSILRLIFSTFFYIILLLILEIYLLLNFYDTIQELGFVRITYFLTAASIIYLINSKRDKSAYKISWMIIFLVLPGFGVLLYIVIRLIDLFNKGRKKIKDITIQSQKFYNYKYSDFLRKQIVKYKNNRLNHIDTSKNTQMINELTFFHYLDSYAKLPVYNNTDLHYFNNGNDAFCDIIDKLKLAKKFIFIEIFILADGIVWQEILKVLKEKAKNGVEVRIMFDGLNALSSFTKSYCKVLKSYNIDAKVFKPIAPVLSNTQNRRDHRKIFVIDNEVAYTGGINIADEYANLYDRFGYWKDAAIRVTGNAVESFTVMFLQVWQVDLKTRLIDFSNYLPKYSKKIPCDDKNAFTLPYTDYPSLYENISLQIYKYMFNNANNYMYIMTPYLVIDEEMVNVIESCAKRGVDVRIIVPHIPDKKYVFYVNRSYYKSLTLAGAHVYEYMPGFVHAKVYLSDNLRGVVGTANLDFRSLYLHYENGAYFYNKSDVISDIKADFDSVFDECKEMTLPEIANIPKKHRVFGAILRVIAPLL